MNWRSIPETKGYRFVFKLIDRPAGPVHRSIAVTYVHQPDRRWSIWRRRPGLIYLDFVLRSPTTAVRPRGVLVNSAIVQLMG
jgi:hypothetical protein